MLLLRWGANGKNGVKLSDSESTSMNMHSRAIELRTEVVKGRVYIHPLPQLLDDIAYLIVCIPPRGKTKTPAPILGILVDCGDADSVIDQLELIRDVHYANVRNNTIEVRALLCTHKHHDHTAGIKALLQSSALKGTLKDIYGGAVEGVPYCTKPVKNGDLIPLPKEGNNDMGKLLEIECIAVPSHTRGSVVFALRNKPLEDFGTQDVPVFSYLFPGDSIFSGGAGVPFEADIEFPKDATADGKTVHSNFKPNAGVLSTERCFAEVLRRAVKDEDCGYSSDGLGVEQMIIYPGHEYTFELTQRQFQSGTMNIMSQLNRHHPSVFFELCSAHFIAGHRRNLPKSTRLLTVPTTVKRELSINPNFRSLRKRGEQILTAVSVWHKYLHDKERRSKEANGKASNSTYLLMPSTFSNDSGINHSLSLMTNSTDKSPSSENTWNVNHADLNRPIFTTVYTNDLENIVQALKAGKMSSTKAAIKLSKLSEKIDNPIVHRRPIPNTLPSERKMYHGIVALAILGSPPAAMSRYDSNMMNLPAPVNKSDDILISKKLLISTLFRLGLMPDNDSEVGANDFVRMINLLWEDARRDCGHDLKLDVDEEENGDHIRLGGSDEHDLIELGYLKLTLFGLAPHKPSLLSKLLPFKSTPKGQSISKIRRSGGDLVKHDTGGCPVCANALGCPKDDSLNHDSDDDDLSYDTQPSTPTNEVHVVSVSPTRSGDGGNIELRAARGVPKRKIIIEGANR